MIIVGHHRSATLAQRHLRALRREHKGSSVEIVSRRNASGRYSGRGQYFWFEVVKLPTDRIELVAHFDYASTKAKDLLRFQVHIIGPSKTTDREALEVIVNHFSDEEPYPRGWKEKIIFWGHTRGDGDVEQEYNADDSLQTHLAKLAILGGERKVSRRNPVRKNRRTGRKAAK